MKKNFEKDYINEMDSAAPDMEKLWQRIAASECSDEDITPFESAAEETAKVRPNIKAFVYRSLGSVAAVFAAVICLSFALGNNAEVSNTNSENSADIINSADEVNTQTAEEYDDASDEISEINSSIGWEYVPVINDPSVQAYEMLSLAYSDSSVYTNISSDNGNEEFFVEETVLSRTDYFVDGKIISAENFGNYIVYTMEVIHLVSDTKMSIPEEFTAISRSPYALRENREYLLPISEENGNAYIVFDNAPQIEIAEDRTVICHNGWRSLSEKSLYISYPQVYEDDYFYDRMNITAESSLENLFESWEKLRI